MQEPVAQRPSLLSFFADTRIFPAGSAMLDDALLMRHIPVRWKALPLAARRPQQRPGIRVPSGR
ncbi:MAG TPA: hypothetical protein VGJ59_00840 [Jatrophihabitantaceae bacterium]